MNDIQSDVTKRVSELNQLFSETAAMVPGYTLGMFKKSLAAQILDLNIKANELMRANGGHLDNEAVRVEILAIGQVLRTEKAQ